MTTFRVVGPPRIQNARVRGGSPEKQLEQVSGEVRALLQWLFQFYTVAAQQLDGESVAELEARITDLTESVGQLTDLVEQNQGRLDQITDIAFLAQSISDPPTAAQVANIQDKVNEIIEQSQINPP